MSVASRRWVKVRQEACSNLEMSIGNSNWIRLGHFQPVISLLMSNCPIMMRLNCTYYFLVLQTPSNAVLAINLFKLGTGVASLRRNILTEGCPRPN